GRSGGQCLRNYRAKYKREIIKRSRQQHTTIPKGEEIMSTNTIRLQRVLRAAPDKIYRAFLDPDAMAKWLHRQGSSYGRQSWRYLQNVVHKFQHGQKPFLRRNVR